MASLGKNKGPYELACNIVSHRNAKVTTIVNTAFFDNYLFNMDEQSKYNVGYIPLGYEHRPDLISNLFYGTPKNWWLLMLVNNISDPFEGFKIHERILIPKV